MKLGTFAFITLYSSNAARTNAFCLSLGFSPVAPAGNAMLLTDGNLYFDIRQADKAATMLSYCVNDIPNAIEMAVNLEIEIVEQSAHHAILREPNGLLILLAGPDIVSLKEFSRQPSSLCGTFYEFSLETATMDRSIVWWQNVGFKVITRKETWCTLDDGKIMVGLYQQGTCPHQFRNPSLTYFEPDMEKRIAALKGKGVSILQGEEEIGMKGHAVVESPDGQFFFLFTA